MEIKQVELEGQSVRLVPMQLQHVPELFAAGNQANIWTYMTARMESLADMQKIVEQAMENRVHGLDLPFVIVDKSSNRVVGSTRYLDISIPDRHLEIGWTWLTPSVWRSAINTECKYLLLRHAFEELGAVRVQIKTDGRNFRSQRAIERLGAVKEGVLRRHRCLPDGYIRDTVYYSVLEGEWASVKQRLEGFMASSSSSTGPLSSQRDQQDPLEVNALAKDVKDDIKSAVQEQFGRSASEYVTSPVHAEGADLKILLNWLNPQSNWSALDIATGGGHVAKALSPLVKTVVAADLTPGMLDVARSHLYGSGCDNVSFVLADAESLPFLDESFDAVTCRMAAHHFPDPAKFISEVSRVLRPGGRFVLIDNIAPDEQELANFLNVIEELRDNSHVRCLSVPEWNDLLIRASLVVEQQTLFDKTHAFQSWLWRMTQTQAQGDLVEQTMQTATPAIKEHYHIQETNGRIETWSEQSLIVVCQKLS